eukprot:195090_1
MSDEPSKINLDAFKDDNVLPMPGWICNVCEFKNINQDKQCIFCSKRWKCNICQIFNNNKNTKCILCKNKKSANDIDFNMFKHDEHVTECDQDNPDTIDACKPLKRLISSL